MKKLHIRLAVALSVVIGIPRTGYSDPVEYVIETIDPTIIERVEFLPNGHMGKNKPRYERCKWKKHETAFFEIYTCDLEEEFVDWLLEIETEVAKEYSERTKYQKFDKKIKIHIPNSARHFQETNLFPGLVPKGLGGFTEILKRKRVVTPFRDSAEGFRRLFRHELAHRFQIELEGITLFRLMDGNHAPLWFTEGSAEHMAHPLDPRSALIMRDAYMNKYLAHVHAQWHPILIYTQGEYAVHFMAAHYKHKGDVVTQILKACKDLSFPEAFTQVTGETLEEFDKALQRHIEKEYFHIRGMDDITDEAKTIGQEVVIAAKDKFFITKRIRFGREELYLNWTDGHTVKSKKLASSMRLKEFDLRGLPIEVSPEFGFQEHGASFASTTTLLYAIDRGGKDVIVEQEFSFDDKKKKITLRTKIVHKVEGVRDIQYPVKIREDVIAFVGRTKVFAELYTFDTETEKVQKLTSHRRTYRGLDYSTKYDLLITSIENERTGSYDLAAYNLRDGKLYFLTESPDNDFSASVSPDGSKILYVSDKGLVHNIYQYDLDLRTASQLTDVRVGVFHPKWFGENGMMFNAFDKMRLHIKTAPFEVAKSTAARKEKVARSSSSAHTEEIEKFKSLLPNAEEIIIFETAISSDKTKALFMENRVLSLATRGRKDPDIRFHFVDLSTPGVRTFTLKKFKKLKDFESALILANSQILLQRSETYRDKEQVTDYDGKTVYVEKEKVFKEAFLYDPHTDTLEKLEYEVWGDGFKLFRISSDTSRLLWANESSITVYDVIQKKEIQEFEDISSLQDVEFVSEDEIIALGKEWDLQLHYFVIGSTDSQKWDITTKEERGEINTIRWRLSPEKKKVFFMKSLKKKKDELEVKVFDLALGTFTARVRLDVSVITKEKFEQGKIVLISKSQYGLEKTITIDEYGAITAEQEGLAYDAQKATSAVRGHKEVEPRVFKAKNPVRKRPGKLSKYPTPYYAYGAGGVSVGDGRVRWYTALDTIFLDEFNDRAFWGNVYMQGDYGLANLVYYNLPKGMSYNLNHWNFGGGKEKTGFGISKNIFLHPLLNWDVSLKEEYRRAEYKGHSLDSWRTKAETTFSADTTVWDWHGPHSGFAGFTRFQAGADEHSRYQGIDLNLDTRYYLPITERSGMAFRLAGGRGFGPNPTLYVWGGNKTFRGTTFDGQIGDSYALHSSELRVPLLDAVGAIVSGPPGQILQFFTIYVDVRGGMYYDVGDMWYEKNLPLNSAGHKGFTLQQSAGAFVNVPTIFGINLRFSQEIWWGKQFNFWFGYNW